MGSSESRVTDNNKLDKVGSDCDNVPVKKKKKKQRQCYRQWSSRPFERNWWQTPFPVPLDCQHSLSSMVVSLELLATPLPTMSRGTAPFPPHPKTFRKCSYWRREHSMNRVWTGPKHVTFDNLEITTGCTFHGNLCNSSCNISRKKKQDTLFPMGTMNVSKKKIWTIHSSWLTRSSAFPALESVNKHG